MTSNFNCPNCGGANKYTGEGNILHCQFCGSDIPVPEKMANEAAAAKISSKARVWIILFVVVVFVLPTCIGFGGTLLGVLASVLGTIITIFASIFGS
jgi:hypothetical protein